MSLALCAIHVLVLRPHLGLCGLQELHEHGHIDGTGLVIGCHVALHVPALHEQILLNVGLKILFLGLHCYLVYLFFTSYVFVYNGFLILFKFLNLLLFDDYQRINI